MPDSLPRAAARSPRGGGGGGGHTGVASAGATARTRPDTEVGDVVHAQRSSSEGFWEGPAGNACRADLAPLGKDVDTLDHTVGQTKTALQTFADDIDTVTSKMSQARSVAQQGGLIVTPTAILPRNQWSARRPARRGPRP